MADALTLPAPAKLNLFLHILGRRDDGYHRLQTVFQLLDYGDELAFKRRDDGHVLLHCDIAQLQTPDNLVLRAVHLMRRQSGSALGVEINLLKRLPMGGGVGGGSSDAATTLLALNQLWDCQLSENQLADLGRQLGADVPVFVRGHSAWADGVGEQLQAIDLPEIYYLVITPDCPVSTASIFAHPELTRDSTAITVAAFLKQGGRNDCQPLVEKLYPKVKDVVSWLQQHSPSTSTTLMTGTGASVFTSFDTESAATALLAKSPWPGFVAKGINQSPVQQRLAKLTGQEALK
jgi:4-diphosphocytidyl-2-C-methyl-D-erythritol kinase